jgi:hypothetical protein
MLRYSRTALAAMVAAFFSLGSIATAWPTHYAEDARKAAASASAAPNAPSANAGPSGAVGAPATKGEGGPGADDGPPTPSYEKFTTGAEIADGIFPLVRKDGKVYMTLAKAQFDTDFYEHATTANGLGGFGVLSGDDFEQPARIIRFQRVSEKRVAIVVPQQRLLGTPGTPIQNAIAGSTSQSVLAVVPVVAEDKASGKVVIDTSFLLSDTLDLGNQLSDIVKKPDNPAGGYRLDPTRTYFGAAKAFPKNDVIEADQTYVSSKPDGTINTVEDPHSVQMRVKYNFAEILSSPDYMPRLADDRVGFWEDPHINFDRDDSYDNIERFVTRWNLRASDPTRPSPAVKPLVYTLTNTIPMEYHGAIRDAILEWNKAFARVGILNAIQVQEQPNDPSFDPDDIRYNTIRWLTEASGGGFAEAQIEWDPRTGEIFRSGVLIDSDIMRYGKFAYSDIPGPESGAPTNTGAPSVSDQIPELWDPATVTVSKPRVPTFIHRDSGGREEAQFGALAMSLYGEEVPSSFTYDFLKSIVMHEVGHDFGLAHNFMGHDAYTADELRSRSFTQNNGIASSVMEYSPLNLWPRNSAHGDYFQPTIGPYDYHAIHWGYAPIPGAHSPTDEVPTLDRWASVATDPKYAFASDEDVEYDGHAVDPRISQYMLTNDSISWCKTQLGMYQGLMHTLDSRYPRPQMPWDQERFAFRLLMTQYGRCSLAMTHYIGGEYLSRARRGDPGAPQPLTPVSRTEEQRAFSNLDRYLFQDSAWQISPVTLRRLTYSEYEPEFNLGYDPTPRHDVSLASTVATLQNRAMQAMFSTLMLQRIVDLPSKAGASYNPMTVGDLFTWMQGSVYGDIANGNPGRSVLHHNLQRNYARLLEHIAVAPSPGTPYDAQALALHELSSLSGQLRHDLGSGKLDLQTRAHLEALQSEVARTLDTRSVTPAGS